MSTAHYRKKVHPIEVDGRALVAKCARCGRVDCWTLSSFPPVEVAEKHFTQRGWGLRRRPVCPDCQAANRTKTEKAMSAAIQPTPANVTPIKAETAAPSDAAKRMRRAVYQWLEEAYDEGAKGYRPGFSDDSIANDTGASPDFVRNIREQDFGPLAKPGELVALENLLTELTARHEQAEAKFLAEVADLRGQLARIVKRNGWAA